MAKRLFDLAFAATSLLLCWPLLLLSALGVLLSDGRPILFRARRAGRGGREFTLYKFRTMRIVPANDGAAITARRDARVFPCGELLRRTKVDELPQLLNVLRGDMSIVGPRPEDPTIVERHYTPHARRTLDVRPGLASPGSIYNYTHGESLLGGSDPEATYVRELLPLKLALEFVYLERRSMSYDLRIVLRTAAVILLKTIGVKQFRDPPELARARELTDRFAVDAGADDEANPSIAA